MKVYLTLVSLYLVICSNTLISVTWFFNWLFLSSHKKEQYFNFLVTKKHLYFCPIFILCLSTRFPQFSITNTQVQSMQMPDLFNIFLEAPVLRFMNHHHQDILRCLLQHVFYKGFPLVSVYFFKKESIAFKINIQTTTVFKIVQYHSPPGCSGSPLRFSCLD